MPRANGQRLTVERLKPTDDVRIVLGVRGKHHAFLVLLASELEQLHEVIGREIDRQRLGHSTRIARAKEAAVATGNRLRYLREREQRDGYVAAFRDDGIDLRVREGRIEHHPSVLADEHTSLLVEYRVELLAELEEIARTVAVAPKARAMGISGRGGVR